MKNIFVESINHIKKDFQVSPTLIILEMIGTFCSLLAAMTIAFFAKDANLYFAFGNYLTGSVILAITAYLRNNSFLLLLNFCYSIVNITYFIRH